ncbi:MAG: IS5 family transposase [Terrimicrobiaceae bacterium]|nr:IS5 family transposase [Terrimicrobiaceae bacterium]
MLRLSETELDVLSDLVPDFEPSPKGGRPPIPKRKALAGIFWVLDNGAKWKDLPREFGAKSSVHRWFLHWVKAGVFEQIMRAMGRLVEEAGSYRLYECFVDGTFSKAKGGGDGIGCTKVGKGVKIMILVDAKGLPLAVSAGSARPHESGLIQELFGFMLSTAPPQRVIGDKAYDSDGLDAQLALQGIEMIAPNRANRSKTQDGRPLRRYKRRWTVERTIAWLQNYRRLCIRWEKSLPAFQGFLHLACALLLLKGVLG